ncbi:MAG TPA: SpoIIE family protein phosphatase [Blastocatellia bacterium]|nr:SpoIIE family protein phosphatase [Blastocatellia bacterium]
MERLVDASIRSDLVERRERLEVAAKTLPDREQVLHLNHLIREVDLALERVSAGTYGLCETCHDSIEVEILKSDPLARYCIGHLTPEEQHALEQDLDLAAQVQGELLPQRWLQYDGWDICYHYQPLGPVSGDYCDVLKSDDCLFFVLGDVSGKGVAASMLMAHLHAVFRSLATVEMPLDKLVERANRVFCESTLSQHYATLICGRAFPTGQIEIVNAGHCPGLIYSKQGVTTVDATGLPVGIFCSGLYSVTKLKLDPGSSLLLYTDGLSEARDRSDLEYGLERLSSLMARSNHDSSEGIIETCLSDLRSFQNGASRSDDMTVMAIRRCQIQ